MRHHCRTPQGASLINGHHFLLPQGLGSPRTNDIALTPKKILGTKNYSNLWGPRGGAATANLVCFFLFINELSHTNEGCTSCTQRWSPDTGPANRNWWQDIRPREHSNRKSSLGKKQKNKLNESAHISNKVHNPQNSLECNCIVKKASEILKTQSNPNLALEC